MYSKLVLVFLSTFVLVQCSVANPIPEEASTEKPHAQLFIYTLQKFTELVDSGLVDGKELLQHVVDEFSAQENNNEEVKEKLEKCKKLLADIKELDTRDDSEEMFDKFFFLNTLEKLMGKSDATESEEASRTEPTSVDKQFFESFEKHGKDNFEKKYNEKFEEFAKDFITVSDRLLYSTSVEDWPEKTKYIDWFNKFKAEENLEKRIDMFDKFIPFFI